MKEKYGFEAFNFQDDSFTVNRKHAIAVCEEILSRKLKIKWYCSLRVDRASKDKELLELMKKAGCIALGFGIEFPSDDVLKKIRKNTTVKMIESALRNVAEVGFPYVIMFLMNSLPGQNRLNTIQAQLNINRFNKILYGKYSYQIIHGGLTMLYPGTEIFKLAVKQGNILSPDFSWNRYYKNPHPDNVINRISAGWSMPIYENINFPIKELEKTLQETHFYLLLRKIIDLKSIKLFIRTFINPQNLKIFRDAISIWLTLKNAKNTNKKRPYRIL